MPLWLSAMTDRGHFPWHYTAYGVLCACGRPCDGDELCEVVRRALRVIPPDRGAS